MFWHSLLLRIGKHSKIDLDYWPTYQGGWRGGCAGIVGEGNNGKKGELAWSKHFQFFSALHINSFLGRIYPFQQLLTISPACPQSGVAWLNQVVINYTWKHNHENRMSGLCRHFDKFKDSLFGCWPACHSGTYWTLVVSLLTIWWNWDLHWRWLCLFLSSLYRLWPGASSGVR